MAALSMLMSHSQQKLTIDTMMLFEASEETLGL